MKLIHSQTRQPILPGDTVTTFRGEVGTLIWAEPPLHDASTGRVGVQMPGSTMVISWFPGVISAEFVEVTK